METWTRVQDEGSMRTAATAGPAPDLIRLSSGGSK